MSARLKPLLALLAATAAAVATAAVEWVNIDEDHYVAGRKCSPGYLKGKVVLVCREKSLCRRMEEIWTNFKTKPFVLLGDYEKAPKDVSHPVYRGVALSQKSPDHPLYIVDSTEKVRYRGSDERRATELVVTFLTDMEAPKSEEQWRLFLDYELASLPGHAYIRFQDYKKRFPSGAKDYAARFADLSKTPKIKKLVELVRFAKSVKDLRAVDPKKSRQVKSRLSGRISDAFSKFADLKEAESPLVVQEAKNALADLAWAKAGL